MVILTDRPFAGASPLSGTIRKTRNLSEATTAMPATYYRHSGLFSPAGALAALAVGSVSAIVLGTLYAYADFYNPIAGWVTFLVTGGTAFLQGAIVGQMLRSGQMRNAALGSLIAFATALLLLLAAWIFWLHILLNRGGVHVSVADLLASPSRTWHAIVAINAMGAWKIKGTAPTGVILSAIWALEAGMLLYIPVKMARSLITGAPFCETCKKWGNTRDLINVNAGDAASLRRDLEQKDFTSLITRGKARSDSTWYYRVYLQGCPACDNTQTLCVDEVSITRRKDDTKTRVKPLVSRLLLTPDETVEVATATALLNAVPPPTESTAAEEPKS
jgi:hypothetical protein